MNIPIYVPSPNGEMVSVSDVDRYVRAADYEFLNHQHIALKLKVDNEGGELSKNEFRLSAQINAIKTYLRGAAMRLEAGEMLSTAQAVIDGVQHILDLPPGV
jgi:hypothetical protein